MPGFLIRLIGNAVAIWVASLIVPGITLSGLDAIVLAAVIFGVVNALIRPIVLAVTCLVNLLTLGLFTFVVNALMLLLTSAVAARIPMAGDFHVDGFVPALVGAIVISLVSFAMTHLIPE